jgi:hypothetical protein
MFSELLLKRHWDVRGLRVNTPETLGCARTPNEYTRSPASHVLGASAKEKLGCARTPSEYTTPRACMFSELLLKTPDRGAVSRNMLWHGAQRGEEVAMMKQ